MGSLSVHAKGWGVVASLLVVCAMLLSSCSTRDLEIHTKTEVSLYSLPDLPNRSGNQVVGLLPAGITLKVMKQILEKDHASSEVEYETASGNVIRGYLILSDGIEVRTAGSDKGT